MTSEDSAEELDSKTGNSEEEFTHGTMKELKINGSFTNGSPPMIDPNGTPLEPTSFSRASLSSWPNLTRSSSKERKNIIDQLILLC